jgi:hypothetical protein
MVRVLAIAVACIAGMAVTWFLVPTSYVTAGVGNEAEASADDPADGPQIKTPMMSAEKRRTRAEQLIGASMKYLDGKAVRSVDWFRDRDRQTIERAMDECFLLTDMELYVQHAAALRREGEIEIPEGASAQERYAAMMTPPVSDVLTCKNAYVVYFEMHGKEFKF